MTGNIIRVLVVDDSSFMRGALVRMIEKDPQFKVIGTAENGREGVDKALALRPDVVTMDVEMPVMNGMDALREIMQRSRLPVVMVSTLTEAGASTTMQALELGAVDFIPKSLQDKDKNIFRGAEAIHEKLRAAANAKVRSNVTLVNTGPVAKAAAPAPAAQIVMPTSNVQRVTAAMMVVGSSTGGPRALQDLLRGLPEKFPVPVLVAQHMPPAFTDALAQRLDETCPPRVVQAQEGDKPEAGKVYVAPGGMHMRLDSSGRLSMRQDAGESVYRPSVDVLAESVCAVHGANVLGVMLTGMGNDGAHGFAMLRKLGAYLIAQDAETCVVFGMPKAIIENGAANEALPVEKIAARVCGLLGI